MKIILIGFVIFLTACYGERDPELSGFHLPYKVGVHQGNILSREKISRLQVGMSKEEVREIMGSPLMVDTFHPNIWTYVDIKRNGKKIKKRESLTLHFQDDLLTRIN